MTNLHPKYLETLQLYYEEEIEGEAYFTALSHPFDDPGQCEKLRLLAEVERFAAAAVVPLIEKYKLAPRPSAILVRNGEKEAAQAPADWPALLAEMNGSYPGYLQAFRKLEALGPPQDQPLLTLLSAHEVAALDFLALEGTAPHRSAEPLRAYLRIDPANWP